MKSGQRQTRNISNKENVLHETQASIVSTRFCILPFFQCVFGQSDLSSREVISKPINCKQTNLPLKRRNVLVNLYSNDLCFDYFILDFRFWICTDNRSCYWSRKTVNIFTWKPQPPLNSIFSLYIMVLSPFLSVLNQTFVKDSQTKSQQFQFYYWWSIVRMLSREVIIYSPLKHKISSNKAMGVNHTSAA